MNRNKDLLTTRLWIQTDEVDDYGDPIEGHWGEEITLTPASINPRRITAPDDGQTQYSDTDVVAYWSDMFSKGRLDPAVLDLRVGQKLTWVSHGRDMGTYRVSALPKAIRNSFTGRSTYRLELSRMESI